jgi:DNA-binding NarL/FixJ family response regulator
MAQATRILVADDHPLYRDALVSAIGGLKEDCEVSVSGSFDDAMKKLADDEFDLVLLDLQMPGSQGLSGLAQLRAHYPSAPVVIVSATEDTGTIRRSLAMGAAGYVPKSSSIDEMREAVRLVLLGEVYVPENIDPNSGATDEESELIERLRSLTPQQTRVLGMLGEGLLNKQIAYELGVSEATVKAHVSAILLKLRVDSRTQAVIQLGKLGATAEAVMANGSGDQPSA